MKKLTALFITLAVLGMAFPAFAQSETSDDVPSQLIHIDATHIQGDITKIDVYWEKHKDRPEFKRMSRLKTSFLDEVADSTNANALR
jgi:hypothetical protein